MAHFAQLDENNNVIQVIVVSNENIKNELNMEDEQIGIQFCKNLLGQDTNWAQTSYNGNFRKNYAGIGFEYDEIRNAFIPLKPFDSWVLNEQTCQWESPIPYPNDINIYVWNEEIQNWQLATI